MENRFIADVHLGKLARLLRMLGFDAIYENNLTEKELIRIRDEQHRILLTRNSSFNEKENCFLIKNEHRLVQLREVLDHFQLRRSFHPFSRCIACNGMLRTISKEKIVDLLQKNTADYFHEFWQCVNCQRIYWKGSHYEKMLKTIETIG